MWQQADREGQAVDLGDRGWLMGGSRARRSANRAASTAALARLSGVILSNSFQASIGSPIWRKPAAVFRWDVAVAQGQDQGIDDVRDAPLALHGGHP